MLKIDMLLKKYGMKPNVLADQHFMIDDDVLSKMVELGGIEQNETVLEIGSGYGNLTVKIAEKKPVKVYAIEKDARFEHILKEELSPYPNVEVIVGDALQLKLPKAEKIFSNTPYSISEAILQKLAYQEFNLAIMTFPKPFVDIVTAKQTDSKYSKLSIMASATYNITLEATLNPEVFFPPPKVNSALVRISQKKPVDFCGYLIRSLFLQKDKKLKNALRESLIRYSVEFKKKPLTKSESNKIISSMPLKKRILEKTVALMPLEDIQELIKVAQENPFL